MKKMREGLFNLPDQNKSKLSAAKNAEFHRAPKHQMDKNPKNRQSFTSTSPKPGTVEDHLSG